MSQQRQKIVLESTNILDLIGLKDQISGAYLEDATVTVSLLDGADQVVLGAEELPAPHVEGTTGKLVRYRASIPADLALAVGEYTAKVVATAQDGSVRTFPVPVDVVALP